MANEKFDKAIPMYEQALSVDPRHYNAWWGLGNIYYRQEEFETARYHFLKAIEINKGNSVLRCFLGMVLESLQNPLMALEYFERATEGDAQNAMAYFQKACVLMSLDRYSFAPRAYCVSYLEPTDRIQQNITKRDLQKITYCCMYSEVFGSDRRKRHKNACRNIYQS